jgi:ATP-binding cassette, subfamily B, multidrug efflux pump
MLKLYKNLKPFTIPIVIVLVLVFLQSMANLYLPTLMGDIVNTGIMQGDTDYIWKTGGTMLLYVGGSVVAAIIASYFASRTAVGLGRNLRNKVFTTVESFSLHEFDKIGTSTLITRTTNDITQVQMVTVLILNMMASAPFMAIGGIILAYSKDHELTLVLAVAIPVLVITVVILASRALPLFRSIQAKIDRINLVLRENLTGIRVIRAFNRIDDEKKRFEGANKDLTTTYIKVNRLMAFMMPIMMLIMSLTTLAITWFGAHRVDAGMDPGSLTAFIQYAMQIMFAFLMFAMMFIMVPRAQAAAGRINEVLATKPEIVDPKEPKPSNGMRGTVEFRDAAFSYHGAEQPAISGITFTALPGEVTAIIGGTGSGKSTLVNLIPRFYDVDSGAVLVDGVDVREMTQHELRAKIGFVPQKSVLFTGSIADNIRFGNDGATEGVMEEAAGTAQAMDFISEKEEKFDFMIAEGGTNVSGGQKQRLSIARALARKPEIYVFDDSFSALDFKTDARLRAALKKQTAEATVFIISQRVSTVMDSDRIVVMDEGKIAGIGTHRELIKSCDVYREIASSQLSEEELA